ncbi:hypothetical protein ANMWB30_23320 [Arthrobacter sp. MWB30]|nr:hypothetical protein ANMWB30_23320 [Arthrobacter sp. MWB30]
MTKYAVRKNTFLGDFINALFLKAPYRETTARHAPPSTTRIQEADPGLMQAGAKAEPTYELAEPSTPTDTSDSIHPTPQTAPSPHLSAAIHEIFAETPKNTRLLKLDPADFAVTYQAMTETERSALDRLAIEDPGTTPERRVSTAAALAYATAFERVEPTMAEPTTERMDLNYEPLSNAVKSLFGLTELNVVMTSLMEEDKDIIEVIDSMTDDERAAVESYLRAPERDRAAGVAAIRTFDDAGTRAAVAFATCFHRLVGVADVSVPVEDFQNRTASLVERTRQALFEVFDQPPESQGARQKNKVSPGTRSKPTIFRLKVDDTPGLRGVPIRELEDPPVLVYQDLGDLLKVKAVSAQAKLQKSASRPHNPGAASSLSHPGGTGRNESDLIIGKTRNPEISREIPENE